MTVCIAALCENSSQVVLVADRMITSGLAIQFEHPLTRKVTSLSKNCLALTAGDALAFTELFNDVLRVTSNRRFTAVEEFVEVIKNSYQELRKKQIVERILRPWGFDSFEDFYTAHGHGRLPDPLVFGITSQITDHDYGLQILVGGITFQDAHIYSIEDPGTSHCFDSIGFHVIGMGTNLALSSLIASKCHAEMSMPDVLMRVMDAKLTAENAPGVGRQTDVSVILNDGVASLRNGQMKQLKSYCRKWKGGDMSALTDAANLIEGVMAPKNTTFPVSPEPNTIEKIDEEVHHEGNPHKTTATEHVGGVAAGNETSAQDGPGEGTACSPGSAVQGRRHIEEGSKNMTAGAGVEPAPG